MMKQVKSSNILHSNPILFYDGECGFCNRSVQFVLGAEKNQIIHFCPLQSNYAKKLLQKYEIEICYQTLYFYNHNLKDRSSAVLALVPFLKWYYQWLKLLWIVPKPFRDFVYDVIAKRRHKILKGYCMRLSEEQQSRFIDE